MDDKELKQECLNLMDKVDAVYLSTFSSDGFPHTRMMSNLRNKQQNPGCAEVLKSVEKNFDVYFVTGDSSEKMRQIRANANVSTYFCRPAEFQTLLLCGTIQEIDEKKFKNQLWQDGWEIHWPGGVEDPEFVVLKFSPVYAKGWYKEGPFEFELGVQES